MDPARKRTIRLVVALSCAVLLAGALVFTSFNASSEARTPSQLLTAVADGKRYQLTGKVVEGSIDRDGPRVAFRVRDREGARSVPVRYQGAIPDTFKDEREIIITVQRRGDVFVGERDSLVTKCPSKFEEQKTAT